MHVYEIVRPRVVALLLANPIALGFTIASFATAADDVAPRANVELHRSAAADLLLRLRTEKLRLGTAQRKLDSHLGADLGMPPGKTTLVPLGAANPAWHRGPMRHVYL